MKNHAQLRDQSSIKGEGGYKTVAVGVEGGQVRLHPYKKKWGSGKCFSRAEGRGVAGHKTFTGR